MLLDTRPRPHRHSSDMIDNFRQRPEARRPSTKRSIFLGAVSNAQPKRVRSRAVGTSIVDAEAAPATVPMRTTVRKMSAERRS